MGEKSAELRQFDIPGSGKSDAVTLVT